jgi:hypothetical protein
MAAKEAEVSFTGDNAMTWRRDLENAPTDDPVLLMTDSDAGFAVRRENGGWALYDPEDPSNVRLAEAGDVKGWRPLPRTPEEASRAAAEAEAWVRELPQRELVEAYQRRDAAQRGLREIEQAEAAEAQRQRDAAEAAEAAERRRQQDAAEAERLSAVARGLGATRD